MEILLITAGGGLGALLRFFIIQLANKISLSKQFATIFVNVAGSFFIGLLSHRLVEQETFHLFFTVGILGGFTTYSTFSFESVQLLVNKKFAQFLLYAGINMIGGLLLFLIGFSL